MVHNTRRARSGFTLLEALVALIMFGVIMTALSLALTAALRSQKTGEARLDDIGTARAVFDALTRDIQAAYASPNSPASQFVAGPSAGSSASSTTATGTPAIVTGSLLALTTLNNRVISDDPSLQGAAANSASSTGAAPQSDMSLVRYDADPTTGTVTRMASAVPSSQNLSQPTGDPGTVLAQNVKSLTLRFWDSQQKTWRDDWDFEQPAYAQNLAAQAAQSGGTGSAAASGGAAGGAGSSTQTPTTVPGDSMLPTAVEVTLVIRRSDGTPMTYTTTIPVAATQPLDVTNNPALPATSGTTTGTGQ